MKREQNYYGMGLTELRPVPDNVRRSVKVLRAVNHKLRQRMIDLLRENEYMSVTDIYIRLRLEQSVASQHLAVLRREGIVDTQRIGKFITYSVNEDRVQQIMNCCTELTQS